MPQPINLEDATRRATELAQTLADAGMSPEEAIGFLFGFAVAMAHDHNASDDQLFELLRAGIRASRKGQASG